MLNRRAIESFAICFVVLTAGCESEGTEDSAAGGAVAVEVGGEPGTGGTGPTEEVCTTDAQCDDGSPCTRDFCDDGLCRWMRSEPAVESEVVLDEQEGVVGIALGPDSLFLAKGEEGYEAWDLSAVPPRRDVSLELEDGDGPIAGGKRFTRGYLAYSGRKLRIFSDTGSELSTYRAADEIKDIELLGNGLVAMAVYAKGVEIIEIGNGVFPSRVGRVDTLGRAVQLSKVGSRLYIADGLLGVSIADIREPTRPVLVTDGLSTEGRVNNVSALGRWVLLGESGTGLGVARFDNGVLTRISLLPLREKIIDVAMLDGVTALVVTDEGISLYDLSDVQNPVLWTVLVEGEFLALSAFEGRFAALDANGGVTLFDRGCAEGASLPEEHQWVETGGAVEGDVGLGGTSGDNADQPAQGGETGG